MDKKLVCVFVPAINEFFDMFVPVDEEIKTLIGVIAKGVSDLSSGRYVVSGHEMLNMRNPETLFNPTARLQDYSVPDGAELILL